MKNFRYIDDENEVAELYQRLRKKGTRLSDEFLTERYLWRGNFYEVRMHSIAGEVHAETIDHYFEESLFRRFFRKFKKRASEASKEKSEDQT